MDSREALLLLVDGARQAAEAERRAHSALVAIESLEVYVRQLRHLVLGLCSTDPVARAAAREEARAVVGE